MNFKAPPTLLELVKQRLLKDEDLAVSALQYLPKELVPPLFMEAFFGRCMKILREMVAAWPFSCLPVGALMETPHLETLKAVLDGVDKLLTHKVSPRSRKLQVLDLRNVQHSFWNPWAGMEDAGCSSQVASKKQIMKYLPRYALRRRLKVLADLSLRIHLSEYQTYLWQWAEQRKSSVQLCCPRMQIFAFPIHSIRNALKIFRPEYIEELELYSGWNLSILAWFSPYLGQMRNLHKLFLARIFKNNVKVECTSPDLEERCVTKFISQFSRFNNLQHLNMNGLHFLIHRMKQLFRAFLRRSFQYVLSWADVASTGGPLRPTGIVTRLCLERCDLRKELVIFSILDNSCCLKTPLETLFINDCLLSQCDLNSLFRCQSLCQLKHLNVSDVELFDLHLMDLGVFLETVADTLQILELEHCMMGDSQLSALLPALSQCSQLTKVNFYDNDISTPVLRDLLQCTANLSHLTLELYPAPLECYDDTGNVLPERFAQICFQLMDTLRAIRKPKMVSFATYFCLKCCSRSVYELEAKLCYCWQ